MMAEAMKYAVGSVNNNLEELFGYSLKIKEIYGSDNEDDESNNVLQTFLTEVPFLIGPYSAETLYQASILRWKFQKIAISYSATFSDFDSKAMLRTVPSNIYRVQALLKLVKQLEWNYVAIISSYGHDGELDALKFISKLSQIGVCIGEQIYLQRQSSANNNTFDNAIVTIQKDPRIKTVILFTVNSDSRSIMKALKDKKLEQFYHIICAFGCINYKEVVEEVENVAVGTISLDIHYRRDYKFEKHFLSLTPTNNNETYFISFWEKVFNCSIDDGNMSNHSSGHSPCTGDEKLQEGKGYYPLTPVHTVIDAVYSFAYVLKELIRNACHKDKQWMYNKTECVIDPSKPEEYRTNISKYLSKISYQDGTLKNLEHFINECQYDIHLFIKERGGYKSKYIGKWVINKTDKDQLHHSSELDALFDIDLTYLGENGSDTHIRARCSEQCNSGYVKVRDHNQIISQCCWNCQKCPPNNIVRNDSCIPCDEKERATESKCVQLPEHYLDMDTNIGYPFQVIILLSSFSGLFLTIFVAVLFIKFNGNRIVRAYGSDLCFMILAGVAILFTCPFPFLAKPSTISCIFRGSLPGIAFLTCYAPLFLKINRIYRIFLHAQTSVDRPVLVSSKFLLLCSFGIVSFQFLLAVVRLVSKMPYPAAVLPQRREYVILTCTGESNLILMLLNVILSVIFMVSSTVLAFKARHFPKNYESKYIGITLYITCVSWALFFPCYFFASSENSNFLREYLMCTFCVLIGYITLLGLYGVKVKLLLCTSKEKLNRKSNGSPNMSFTFKPTNNHEINRLTMEQSI